MIQLFYKSILAVISLYIPFSIIVHAAPAPIVTSGLAKDQQAKDEIKIGATISVAERPFVGVDKQNASLPYISFKYKDFYIEGLDAGYKLYSRQNFTLGLLASPRYYEVEAGFAKNGELDGIDKTRPTYLAGLSSQYNTEAASISFQFLQDIQESDGYEVIFSLSKAYRTGQAIILSPVAGITYQDEQMVDYFYGVQKHEVKEGRPEYRGRASLNYNASLTISWHVARHMELLGQVKYEVLGKGITDSPIVDKSTVGSMTLGALFRF